MRSDRARVGEHPGVNELFALLAYGEVAAFYRLTDEARMAPNLAGRITMARMAAAEMDHYELLRDALDKRGVDIVAAMTRYASALENYHRLTTPSTWLEALVKTYIGDALAADFYLEIADGLPDEVAGVVRAVLSETGHSQFVVAEVRAAVTASASSAAGWRCGRVGCSARRSPRPSTCWPSTTSWSTWWCPHRGPGSAGAFFDRLQNTHNHRVRELGLAGLRRLAGAGRDLRVVGRRRTG